MRRQGHINITHKTLLLSHFPIKISKHSDEPFFLLETNDDVITQKTLTDSDGLFVCMDYLLTVLEQLLFSTFYFCNLVMPDDTETKYKSH